MASCISSWHHNRHIIPAFIIYHIHALHLHKSLHYHTSSFSMLLFCQLHTFYFHCSHVMFTHTWSLHFPLQKKQKEKNKRKSQWSMKVYTTFLVTCVGYHDDSCKQTMLGLYTHFSWKMIENHVNMVTNAWLTKKMMVLKASHVDLIITCIT